MTIPRWSTIGLFDVLVAQFIRSWLQAKKTGKSFRTAVLPSALLVAIVSMILVREFFGDPHLWIDTPLVVLCSLVILIFLGLELFAFQRYLKQAWWLEDKKDK